MRLADYVRTRVVEQVVHLDDLAHSVGTQGWPVPEEAYRIAIETATATARRRAGAQPLLRALYRTGFAGDVFPVLWI